MQNNVRHYPNGNPANTKRHRPPLIRDPTKLMEEDSFHRLKDDGSANYQTQHSNLVQVKVQGGSFQLS
jgi:hypothetical protein